MAEAKKSDTERTTIPCNKWVLEEIKRVKAESNGFMNLLDDDGNIVKGGNDLYYLFSLLNHFYPLPVETAETREDRIRHRKELEE